MRRIMKKLLFLAILCVLFCSNLHAEELYSIENPDGSVTILNYLGGESLTDVLKSMGLEGRPIKKISRTDLPDRADRNFWKMNDVPIGKKIIVDENKKSEKEAEDSAKETERQAVLDKLKINDSELEQLFKK